MRNHRSERGYLRRVSEKERSAKEEAYLRSLRQPMANQMQQPAVTQPPLARPSLKKSNETLKGILIALAIGIFFICSLCSFLPQAASNTSHYLKVTVVGDVTVTPPAWLRVTPTYIYIPPTPDTSISIGGSAGGSTVQCNDGWISHSGGKRGACSHHGGEKP